MGLQRATAHLTVTNPRRVASIEKTAMIATTPTSNTTAIQAFRCLHNPSSHAFTVIANLPFPKLKPSWNLQLWDDSE